MIKKIFSYPFLLYFLLFIAWLPACHEGDATNARNANVEHKGNENTKSDPVPDPVPEPEQEMPQNPPVNISNPPENQPKADEKPADADSPNLDAEPTVEKSMANFEKHFKAAPEAVMSNMTIRYEIDKTNFDLNEAQKEANAISERIKILKEALQDLKQAKEAVQKDQRAQKDLIKIQEQLTDAEKKLTEAMWQIPSNATNVITSRMKEASFARAKTQSLYDKFSEELTKGKFKEAEETLNQLSAISKKAMDARAYANVFAQAVKDKFDDDDIQYAKKRSGEAQKLVQRSWKDTAKEDAPGIPGDVLPPNEYVEKAQQAFNEKVKPKKEEYINTVTEASRLMEMTTAFNKIEKIPKTLEHRKEITKLLEEGSDEVNRFLQSWARLNDIQMVNYDSQFSRDASRYFKREDDYYSKLSKLQQFSRETESKITNYYLSIYTEISDLLKKQENIVLDKIRKAADTINDKSSRDLEAENAKNEMVTFRELAAWVDEISKTYNSNKITSLNDRISKLQMAIVFQKNTVSELYANYYQTYQANKDR